MHIQDKNKLSYIKKKMKLKSVSRGNYFWNVVCMLLFALLVETWALRVKTWALRVETWVLRVETWVLRVETWALRVETWVLRVETWALRVANGGWCGNHNSKTTFYWRWNGQR
jgi:hypothetical protein